MTRVLRRVSYLLVLPGLIALAITLIGAKSQSQASLVVWCTTWWWTLLLTGVLLFYLLRAIAWISNRPVAK